MLILDAQCFMNSKINLYSFHLFITKRDHFFYSNSKLKYLINKKRICCIIFYFLGNMLNKDGAELMVYELYAYMMTHLDKISRTPEYLKSSACVIKSLLHDSHLSVRSELEVFDAAMRWVEFDKHRRIKYLHEIMKNVRFTLISPEELVTKVESQICLTENVDIHAMLYNSFKFHALNVTHCSKLTSFLKKEECRNVCLKGASVPDEFLKALIELSEIAHTLKVNRKYTSYGIVDDCNRNVLENKSKKSSISNSNHHGRTYHSTTCDETSNSNCNNNNLIKKQDIFK